MEERKTISQTVKLPLGFQFDKRVTTGPRDFQFDKKSWYFHHQNSKHIQQRPQSTNAVLKILNDYDI